jgi:hypothetical protein
VVSALARTARDLITTSYKRLGVIAGTETPAADLAADGLDRLRDLLATWSTESLVLWTQTTLDAPAPLVARPFYTVGPGGDFDVPIRPPWIDAVRTVQAGTPNFEIKQVLASRQAWNNERQKTMASTIPTAAYYDAAWPLAVLHLWPVYSGGALVTLRLYLPAPLVLEDLTLNTVLDFPPGYFRALRDALAMELAPEVGRPIDPMLMKIATDAKAQLERVNLAPVVLAMPAALPGSVGGYDWRTDEGG